jgi:hypothetical protein
MTTTHNTITLQGSAVDAVSGVAAVTVNGQPAASSNGFANWSASVPLSAGANTIVVNATDKALPGGNLASTAISITCSPSTMNDGVPDAWKIAHGIDPASANPINGPLGDPYSCGLSNLLAYAFNSDPTAHPMNPVQASTQINPLNGLSYLMVTYPTLIGAFDLTYTVEVSGDLVNWSSGPGQVQPISSTPSPGGMTNSVTVQIMAPLNSTAQDFVHVRVNAQ